MKKNDFANRPIESSYRSEETSRRKELLFNRRSVRRGRGTFGRKDFIGQRSAKDFFYPFLGVLLDDSQGDVSLERLAYTLTIPTSRSFDRTWKKDLVRESDLILLGALRRRRKSI